MIYLWSRCQYLSWLPLRSFTDHTATKNGLIPNDKYNRLLLWIAY
ncbi:hypothetical protein F963_02082 [Acinetobacter bereziniae NIPH 3]|uniref:Uncharacterized protein n=1 Tax=Acinetobacter bereziniae NIPH 3 TaxID=1217651 RepID=N8XC09_ACIBZ|nr:hypothetical protein F963_02082 [Acinetobacter bereziniae NIPH 3]